MPTIKETVVFKFEELSEEAQQKAISDNYNVNVNVSYAWWQFSCKSFEGLAKMLNIRDSKIKGFNVDYKGSIALEGYLHFEDLRHIASKEFKAKKGYKTLEQLIQDAKKAMPKKLWPRTWNVINNLDFDLYARMYTKHYGGSTLVECVNHYSVYNTGAKTDSQLDECVEACENFLNSFKDCLLDLLKEEFEYLTSDEAIKECLIANEYDFLESGKRF